jgi:chromosomal replication initiator protein
MEEFREKYRRTDILLIDDIQFVEKKEGLQTELFHTFNTLFDAHKQIVASSDRPIREIRIEERLRSRFGMGLCADIQPPDFETRLAILKKMVEREQLTAAIPEDVFSFIANKFKSNIRLLEASLRQVVSKASTLHKEISVPQAESWLRDMMEPEQRPVSEEDIKRVVSAHFHLKPGDFESKRRTAHLAFPRQIAMYLVRELTPLSLPETGRLFGNRDHTTVMYAVEQISKKSESDPSLHQLIQDLIKTAKTPRS